MTSQTSSPARTEPSRTPPRIRALVADRTTGLPAWVVLTQLFIGLGWLRAATEKLIDSSWWNGSGITSFLAEHDGLTVGWYEPILDVVVTPRLGLVAVAVMIAQFVVGLSLVSGRFVRSALAVGIFLNLNFLAAGAVNPSAFYLLSQGAIALWLVEQGRTAPRTPALLTTTAIVAATLGVISMPYVTTLHPAEVIDDPAIMLVLGGILAMVGCDLAHRHVTGDGLP